MAVGVLLGCLAVVLGLAVSYHADTAASATVAGIAVLQFFVVLLVSEAAAAVRAAPPGRHSGRGNLVPE